MNKINPENGRRKTTLAEKVIADLKKSAKKATEVLLATDPDREGEAIAWHLLEALGVNEAGETPKVSRVVFHEITKTAIQHALDTARSIDMNRVNAQQTRRLLDRIVGYKLSPLLWEKVAKNLSAGRVQTPALRLIVEREMEIRIGETGLAFYEASNPTDRPVAGACGADHRPRILEVRVRCGRTGPRGIYFRGVEPSQRGHPCHGQ